jgi:hypothetical protein
MRAAASRLVCAGALVLAAAAPAVAARALRTAQDHRGNRIEPFRQLGQSGPAAKLRNCTDDRRWCAALRRDPADGRWNLAIAARGRGRFPKTRHYLYPLPVERCCDGADRSFAIWNEMVREPRGGALIGIAFSRETGERGSFRSYQRRLFLLRVPREEGGAPVPVLEAPLSGWVEQPACLSPRDQRERPGECWDYFYFSTLFTLVPEVAPVEPANLVMIARASTRPGRRSRTDGPLRRAPVERSDEDDEALDPACTFTRSYVFDQAQGRYLPDAPLPPCRDYLEP